MARTPYTPTTSSIADAVSLAYSIVGELRDELQEWYDNLPESFQNGSKGEQLQEAITGLEEAADYEPDVPEAFAESDVRVHDPRPVKRQSRAARAADAAHYLRTVVDEAQAWLDEQESEHDDWVAAQDVPRTVTSEQEEHERSESLDKVRADIEEFIGTVGDHAEAIENVSFPGMY